MQLAACYFLNVLHMSYTESNYHFHKPPRNNTKQDLKAYDPDKANIHTSRKMLNRRYTLHTATELLSSTQPILRRFNVHSVAGPSVVIE